MLASISANHTYSHPSANSVPLWQFGDDVVKAKSSCARSSNSAAAPSSGFATRFSTRNHRGHPSGIMDFLEQRNYRVAPVTVDYADYTFAASTAVSGSPGRADVAEKIKHAISTRSASGSSTRKKPRWSCSATKSRRFC